MAELLELREGTLDLGGTAMRYHSAAGGPGRDPVVLLHPWFGCWQFWSRTIEALDGHPCHALDLYSLGEGDWASYAGPEGLAAAVLEFLDDQGIQRCSLAGNSMGGIAAQALASAWPDRVGRLLLVGTGARTTGIKPDFKAKLDSWIRGDPPSGGITQREEIAGLVGSLLARRPDSAAEWATYVDAVAAADRRFMGTVLATAFELDLRPRLGAVTAPTLVVRGEHDGARTREHVRDLLAGIAGSRAVELAGAGHSPMVDSPGQFTPLARAFFDGAPVGATGTEVAGAAGTEVTGAAGTEVTGAAGTGVAGAGG